MSNLNAVEYAFLNKIKMWIPAVYGDCSHQERAEGEIEVTTRQQASGMFSDVTVNCTSLEARIYNKWNPLMVKAGYPSPLE
jgi:hypothetical protein